MTEMGCCLPWQIYIKLQKETLCMWSWHGVSPEFFIETISLVAGGI